MSNTQILQMGMFKHTAVDKADKLEYKVERGRLSFLVLATIANKNKIKAEMLLTSTLQKMKPE